MYDRGLKGFSRTRPTSKIKYKITPKPKDNKLKAKRKDKLKKIKQTSKGKCVFILTMSPHIC